MTLASITLLCSQQDMQRYLSTIGLRLAVDDNEDGYISADEQGAVTDAQTEASETVYFYCWDKYDPTQIATSNLANRWATILACYRVRSRLGRRVPEQLENDAAKAEEMLQKIQDGPGKLPGVPLRRILAPVMSLTRVDPRFNFRCIRVEKNNSSAWNQTNLRQNVDYQEAYSFEI